jgi:hypothetical protein
VVEKNMVRLSLFLVLVAFAFVYLIFIDRNADLWWKTQEVIVSDKSGSETIVVDAWSNTSDDYTEQDLLAKIKNINNQWTGSKSFLMLTGTTLTYSELESLTKLWINAKYILKGKDDTYFVNLGKWEVELSFRVSKFAGNIKTITDLAEIKKNGFNLLIMNYINIPTRKDNYVIFTTKMNSDNWLVQSKIDSYYKNKWYISDTLNSAY